MIDMPILRIELQGIKQTMMQAFHDYQTEIGKSVQSQIEHLISEDSFKKMIAVELDKHLRDAVSKQIEWFFRHGEGGDAIRESIRKTFLKDKE